MSDAVKSGTGGDPRALKVLALEAYYGGSHRAFLEGWIKRSCHDWTLLTLPANKWKWRMRQSSFVFADEVARLHREGAAWDVLVTSDMTQLAELKGLLPTEVAALPSVLYFHENQITYPVRFETSRDFHFGLTNLTSALAATSVWFNSAYHRQDLLDSIEGFSRKMPKPRPASWRDRLAAKSQVVTPPIQLIERTASSAARDDGPLRLVWAARWEFDKAPEVFFEALSELRDLEVPFEVSVLGESFARVPSVFATARSAIEEHIVHWGYLESRLEFEAALAEADVVVSTARHEFFGLGVLEAVSAGAMPVVPYKLSYPGLFESADAGEDFDPFYRGSARSLALRLASLAELRSSGVCLRNRFVHVAEAHGWQARLPVLEQRLEDVVTGSMKACVENADLG